MFGVSDLKTIEEIPVNFIDWNSAFFPGGVFETMFYPLNCIILTIGANRKYPFDTLSLLPRIVKSTESNLTNGTLADKGGSEHQS